MLVAMTGVLPAKVVESDRLCGTLSRLYKLTLPFMFEDFQMSLRARLVLLSVCAHGSGYRFRPDIQKVNVVSEAAAVPTVDDEHE